MKSPQDSVNDNQEQSNQRLKNVLELEIGFRSPFYVRKKEKNGEKYIDKYEELLKDLEDMSKKLQDIASERDELLKNKTELLEEIDKINASWRNLKAQNEELTRENTNIQKLEVAHPIMVNNLLYLLGEILHDESDLAKSIRNLATVLTANGLTLCYDYEGNPNYFLKEKSDKIQEIRLICPALLRGKNVVVQGELFIPNV